MGVLEPDKERRGRRVSLSCRVFFFGDGDYEGEGRVVDVSTSGCRRRAKSYGWEQYSSSLFFSRTTSGRCGLIKAL